jgi:hypothetical protein
MADKERHNSRVDDGEEIEGGESRLAAAIPSSKLVDSLIIVDLP